MISYRYQFVRLATVRKGPPPKKKTKYTRNRLIKTLKQKTNRTRLLSKDEKRKKKTPKNSKRNKNKGAEERQREKKRKGWKLENLNINQINKLKTKEQLIRTGKLMTAQSRLEHRLTNTGNLSNQNRDRERDRKRERENRNKVENNSGGTS